MLKSLKRVNFKDEETNALQENVYQFLNQINPVITSGVLITSVNVGTSPSKIEHKLGRTPQGFYVVDKNSNSNVWRSSISDNRYLTLTASTPSTISIWVF